MLDVYTLLGGGRCLNICDASCLEMESAAHMTVDSVAQNVLCCAISFCHYYVFGLGRVLYSILRTIIHLISYMNQEFTQTKDYSCTNCCITKL